jgi:hypothetical protein
MRESIQFLVFWARLTSLRMMFSNSIHLPANDNITRIYRELKKLSSPKTNEPIKKWASELKSFLLSASLFFLTNF